MVMDRELTLDECRAWAERYRSTSWSMLALATIADEQPSPLKVLGSLLALANKTEQETATLRQALERLAHEVPDHLKHIARDALRVSAAAEKTGGDDDTILE